MFSRIVANTQSPKKCRPEEMSSLEQNSIIQTSSDDEFTSNSMHKRPDSRKVLYNVQSTSLETKKTIQSNKVKSKPISNRVIFSDDEEDSNIKKSSVIDDITSITSDSTSSDSSSSSSLFENEGDISESDLIHSITNTYRTPLNTSASELPERIEDSAVERTTTKSRKRPYISLQPDSASNSQQKCFTPSSSPILMKPIIKQKSPKSWKITKSNKTIVAAKSISPNLTNPSLFIKQSNKIKSISDYYSYIPSFAKVAIRPVQKQQFLDWVQSDNTNCFCILLGPTGIGKRSLVYSVCNELNMTWISWNDDMTGQTDGQSHMKDFIKFLNTAQQYSNSKSNSSDSIHMSNRQIVLIDLLPSLFYSVRTINSPQARKYKLEFQNLVEFLSKKKRTENSRLFVWVVDTTDEIKGLASIKHIIPNSFPSLYSIVFNPPCMRMCKTVMTALFPHVSKLLINSIISLCHNDLRQMGIYLTCYDHTNIMSVYESHTEDTFWGLFHMIKKLLLGKRDVDGVLENDLDDMFCSNSISLDTSLEYLYTNMPEYTTSLDDCMTMLDDYAYVESIRQTSFNSSYSSYSNQDKETENAKSLAQRCQFMIAGLSTSLHNQHLSKKASSFTGLQPPYLSKLRVEKHTRELAMLTLLTRLEEIEGLCTNWLDFIRLYPSFLIHIEQTLLNDMNLKIQAKPYKIHEYDKN